MGITSFFTIPVTISTPSGGSTDSEGVPTATMSTATVNGHVQPYTAQPGEEVLGRPEAERARRLWLPAATTITANSTVTIDGEAFDVRGDPKRWDVGSSNDHVAVVIVRKIR